MGNQATYSGVMGGLGRLISALNANAADLARLDATHLRSEKLAGLGLQPFRGRKPRTPKSSTPSEPTAPAPIPARPAGRLAADANSKQ
jgi:hypothetical protein